MFFFFCTIVYLYGDLLIYLNIVGNSLKTITWFNNFFILLIFSSKFQNGTNVTTNFCQNLGETNVFRIYIVLLNYFIICF